MLHQLNNDSGSHANDMLTKRVEVGYVRTDCNGVMWQVWSPHESKDKGHITVDRANPALHPILMIRLYVVDEGADYSDGRARRANVKGLTPMPKRRWHGPHTDVITNPHEGDQQ